MGSRHSNCHERYRTYVFCFQTEDGPTVPKAEAAYFGVFDGHAGSGAAIMAANCLHEHVRVSKLSSLDLRLPKTVASVCANLKIFYVFQNRMCQVLETVLHLDRQEQLLGYGSSGAKKTASSPNGKQLTSDSLVIGALEAAFVDMV